MLCDWPITSYGRYDTDLAVACTTDCYFEVGSALFGLGVKMWCGATGTYEATKELRDDLPEAMVRELIQVGFPQEQFLQVLKITCLGNERYDIVLARNILIVGERDGLGSGTDG